MKEIQVVGLRKVYGERQILDVELTCRAGSLHTILGPNGSGKSTLLRLLSLVEKADAGTISFRDAGDNVLPQDLSLRRRMVLAPDRAGLFNNTVWYNIAYGLKLRRLPVILQQQRIEQCLRDVGLLELRHRQARSLSTGEAQRLCLGMALVLEPELIMLDEPTASLDPVNAGRVEELIRRIKERVGFIILVTHNMFQARRLADQVTFLHQGRVIESAGAEDFFRSPQTETARLFVSGETFF